MTRSNPDPSPEAPVNWAVLADEDDFEDDLEEEESTTEQAELETAAPAVADQVTERDRIDDEENLHPLETGWSLYFHHPGNTPVDHPKGTKRGGKDEWEQLLREIGTFDTVC